jgi:hypothetical protein
MPTSRDGIATIGGVLQEPSGPAIEEGLVRHGQFNVLFILAAMDAA